AEAEEAAVPGGASKRIAALALAILWGVLVLLPWLADMAAARGMGAALASTARVENLERASAIAPWDTRNALELGRSLLARAFGEPDPARKRALLSEGQSAFERVTRLSPEDGEARALLARTLASRWAADSTSTTLARIRWEFGR